MELKATTRQGKTLVIDDQTVRVKQVFGDLFAAPRESIIGITVVPVGGVLAGAIITFYRRDAEPYEVQIIDKARVDQIAALFRVMENPPVSDQPVAPQSEEPEPQEIIIRQQPAPAATQARTETKVITYKSARAMEEGLQKEAEDGWIAQGSITSGGKVSIPKMVLLGPLLGGARSKEHFTITFVRQVQG